MTEPIQQPFKCPCSLCLRRPPENLLASGAEDGDDSRRTAALVRLVPRLADGWRFANGPSRS
ncbi:hypothetical protein SBA4_1600011 [Candidatus Sulfopaludibacter sp. SbA4]|nr:hypothetical protein SBA4_1600011 [Candidatus Sulfopaludibacter sp. SbA4]